MPMIKSAKKKLRKDVKRTKVNKTYIVKYQRAIERVKKHKKATSAGRKGLKVESLLKDAYKAIDKAVKNKVIHKHKGSRLKSMVGKLVLK